jgi:predicted dehydrogenase
MRPLQIAVAGAGYIGQAHIQAIANNARLKLAAIVDPALSAQETARQYQVACHSRLEDLLATKTIDGVVLATPNALHVSQTLEVLSAGLPCLLEKPIAPTVTEALQILDASQSPGAKLLIGHHRAHSPIMASACQVIQSGQLGRLVGIMGSATFYKPDHYFADAPWRREKGAGPILLNMIHEVHNLRMLAGDIVAVQAISSNTIRHFPVEDSVSMTFQFASGALGSFLLSDTAACARSWEQTSQENKAYPSYSDEDCYVITGTQGSLAVPTMRMKHYAKAEDRSWWKPFEESNLSLNRADPITRQMDHFADVIHGLAPPLVSAADGLANLRVTEAIVEASKSGNLVRL